MSDDDDTGGHTHHKLAAIEEAGKKPIALKLWVVVAIALVAFLIGLAL